MLTLAQAFPKERVTIAGVAGHDDPYVVALRRRIHDDNLTNVQIVENPTEEQVGLLLTQHETFVFPAPWEHFGIVTVEAIQAGLLPLVHDTGGQREIVPLEYLRFLSDRQLITRARELQERSAAEKAEILAALQSHAQRGSVQRYREEMLREVKILQAG
jgi:glycosyltransferase involved in cell wall biosynthesis